MKLSFGAETEAADGSGMKLSFGAETEAHSVNEQLQPSG